MSVTEEKALLRKRLLQYRRSLSPQEKGNLDTRIAAHVLSDNDYLSAQTVFCYVSLPREIDTARILQDAVKRGKRIAFPRCRKYGRMNFYVVTSPDDLLPGIYGIPEPKETCPLCTPQPDDLCIVPCLAADRHGFRLGYGGGYYDRYLSIQRMRTIGLCYSACMTDALPTDAYDVALDKIITDKEV